MVLGRRYKNFQEALRDAVRTFLLCLAVVALVALIAWLGGLGFLR